MWKEHFKNLLVNFPKDIYIYIYIYILVFLFASNICLLEYVKVDTVNFAVED